MAREVTVEMGQEATEPIVATAVQTVVVTGTAAVVAASTSAGCTTTTVTDLANAVGSTVVPCALAARTGGIVSKTASTKQ